MLPTSIDSLGSHASWAKDAHFPFAMIADTEERAGDEVRLAGRRAAVLPRTVFVIGKDGKIAYADTAFNALAQDGYDKLAAAIKTAKGG